MQLTPLILSLAGGIWVILLVGIVLFAVIAMRAKRQLADRDQIIETLRSHTQRLADAAELQSQRSDAALAVSGSDGGNGSDESGADIDNTDSRNWAAEQSALRTELSALEDECIALRDDCARLSETHEADCAELEQLRGECDLLKAGNQRLTDSNAALESRMESLSESMALGDDTMMKEMIVNFTEESRQLLATIDALEQEVLDLKQFVTDTESSERGTTGVVVGLKRKLADAETEMVELRAECKQLREAVVDS